MRLSGEVLVRAQELIAARLGLQFPDGRRSELERCLLSACREEGVWPPEAYLTRLAMTADETPAWSRLIAGLTVGETYFFRDRAVFAALEHDILPALIASRRSEGIRRLRLWSAGCSTGEEPYSLAILLDRLLPDRGEWILTILATDVNVTTLRAAMRGWYRAWAMRETPREIRDRYFLVRTADSCELRPEICRMVTFAPLNLAADVYPSAISNTNAMDLIFCRNVLMYFGPAVQRAAAARLSQALVPDGWLAVSPAEASAELLNPLVPVNFPGAIFYRKEEAVPVVPQPPARADGPEGEAAGWGREAADLRGAVLDPSFAASTAAGEDVADPAPLLERARLLADQGHLEEARRLWDAALAKDRLNPRAYLLLAAIQQEQGEISDALDALRRAIYLAPDAVMPHFLRGCLLLRQGRRGLGMQCLKTAMHLLSRLPREAVVPDGDGLTAGHLMELAQEYAAIGPVRGDRPRGIHAGQP